MLRPLQDYLLLEPLDQQGDLIAAGDNDYQRGRLLDCGPGRLSPEGTFIAMPEEVEEYAVGTVVHFARFAEKHSTVVFEGKKYYLVRVTELIAVEE